jgi:hypothetical protein
VKYKKIPIVIGALAIAAVGAFLVRQANISSSDIAASANGVVSGDPAVKGLVATQAPQLTDRRFEPLPSMGTGSYTEPAPKADTSKKGGNAKN